MTPERPAKPAASETPASSLSTEDLKRQVLRIRDSALEDVKRTKDEIVQSDQARLAGIAAGVIVVGLSIAYFMGSSRARAAERRAWERRRQIEQDRAARMLIALEDLTDR